MFRHCVIVACIVPFLCVGCGKGEPEPNQADIEDLTPELSAPDGMVMLRGEPVLFIDREPLNAGEYITFLKALQEPVPAGLGDVPASTAVDGLTLEEAARAATFEMKRVPSATEWKLAVSVVGDAPYPWATGEGPATGDIYFVRDWRAGDTGELKATEALNRLKSGANLGSVMLLVKAKRDELEGEFRRVVGERQAIWDELKPALFDRLDKVKELAAAKSAVSGAEKTSDVLAGLLRHKLAVVSGTVEGVTGRSIGSYEEKLTAGRKGIADEMAAVTEKTADLHRQVTDLTAAVEARGKSLVESYPAIEALLEGPEHAINTVRSARDYLAALDKALADLREVKGSLEGLPSVDDIKAKAAELAEDIGGVSVPEDRAKRISELKAKLKKYSDDIGKVFEQEPLFISETQKLIEAKAQAAGVTAKLSALQELLTSIGGSMTSPSAPVDEPAPEE